MNRVHSAMDESGVVAIVRLDDYSTAVEMVQALMQGGITAVEFTYTNPAAGEAVATVKAALGDRVQVGAGTVLDSETARIAILQGADFIVTPIVSISTIELCRRYSIPTVIGSFTATEILTAWQAGATYVKVFPASAVGPGYLKDVLGPLPQVKLIPTGGVTIHNAGDFIRAGASAIAVGSNLVDAKTVRAADWQALTDRAAAFISAVRDARAAR